ncbi:MAG: response regulator [Anaerolineae bacterium]|nr:response regulator [Anaerolineae bacterium]
MRKRVLNTIYRIWFQLTDPAESIKQLDERRQAQFISSLLVGLVLIGAISAAALVFSEDVNASLISGTLTAFGLMVILYILSRTRFYRFAAGLTAFIFIILIISTAYNAATTTIVPFDVDVLVYMIVPILLASTLASVRATIILTVFCLILLVSMAIWLPLSVVEILIGPVTFLLVIATLLTFMARQRDLLEEDRRLELAESEAHYRTLLEATYEGVAIVQNDSIAESNPNFAALFDFTLHEVIGTPLHRYLFYRPNPGIDSTESLPLDVVREGIGVKRDGSHIDVEFIASEQQYQRDAALVVAVRDITERKRTEQALQQAQRLDSIGLLAGGIAHDFNNLLTGVIAQSSMAISTLEPNDPARGYVEKSLLSAEQAAQLTRQLLAYAGKGVTSNEVFDINRLITSNLAILKTSVPAHVELLLRLSNEPIAVEADRHQIQQVLFNLVLNAGQAIPSGRGFIHITTDRVEWHQVQYAQTFIGYQQLIPGPHVLISVKDNGVGMDAAVRTRIFEPFFSTKSQRDGIEGHGLGLSTSLGIVISHHGAIAVNSAPNDGTEFIVLLPAAPLTAPLPEVSDDRPQNVAFDFKGLTALVVDDEETVRDAIEDILRLSAFSVLTAVNGLEGVEQFVAHVSEIDLVILDIKMPGMDGMEVLKTIREMAPDVRVIITSGYSEEEKMARFLADDRIYYLAKPFDIDGLMVAVNAILGVVS